MLYEIYNRLMEPILPDMKIEASCQGLWWTCVTSLIGTGIAMTYQDRLGKTWQNPENLPLHEVAQWIYDWDLRKCTFAMAAINACWNNAAALKKNFKGRVKYNSAIHTGLTQFVTENLALGKVVVSVGHFPFLDSLEHDNLYILEKTSHQLKDLPDTACEEILPKADIALITGSSFVNKSAPRLLALAEKAYTILLGPSTPLFPGLSQFGVNKIIGGGLVLNAEEVQRMVRNSAGGELFFSNVYSRVEIDFDASLRADPNRTTDELA